MTVQQLHDLRVGIDQNIKTARDLKLTAGDPEQARTIALVYTKLQEAKMWAGKSIEALGDTAFPEELKDEYKE